MSELILKSIKYPYFGICLDIYMITESCFTINWMMIFGFSGIDLDPSEMIILMVYVLWRQLYYYGSVKGLASI